MGQYTCVRSVGGLVPPDLLARVLAGGDLPGLRGSDYHLAAGESPREAANRAWSYLLGSWVSFRQAVDQLPPGDPAVGVTRERWLSLLLRELGYGRVPPTAAGGIRVRETSYPVSHEWGATPIHLLGWGVDLDRRTPGVAGAATRAPQAMVQEMLNRSDEHLWGIVSNGRVLRLLRDSTTLVRQAYLEFDLEAMFDGEVFSDFVLLFLLGHQSRVEVPDGTGPAGCWLERWRGEAVESGTRALGLLRDGVHDALETLGTGFLRHPGNADLNRALGDGTLPVADYHRALLRLVYRLLFLFVAEDRGVLHDPKADATARDRYAQYFSSARLRRLATTRRGSQHIDLWQALSLVLEALGCEDGRPELGLPGLGGLFDDGPADVLTGWLVSNQALLTAMRRLAVVQPAGQPRRLVDYRNLGAEELGGIYESLLELVPRHDPRQRTFTLEQLAGNERKTSGSYYTPSGLIELVLDTALDPILDEVQRQPDPEQALLEVTVCDPACGSGHFLVAAARRIATRVATVRGDEAEPTPTDIQAAMRDVVARCIYGVDVNPMAAELAKVSLWLEAIDPGRPMSFLDAHVKVGNSLLGTTPALLTDGIPDAAFKPLEGDDKTHATRLRKRNAQERDQADQGELFDTTSVDPSNQALRRGLDSLEKPALSLADAHVQARRFATLNESQEMRQARFAADAWCAAFLQHKTPDHPAITHAALTSPHDDVDPEVVAEVDRLAAHHRLFHWHLEFPQIFAVPDGGAAETPTGWRGGFTTVVGNPPWERVKLQEKEFFAGRDPDIADAPNAAKRKRAIARLADTNPALLGEFTAARRDAEAHSALLRTSGRFPLTGRGDVNTYSVFAETMRTLIEHDGRMGVITPTGLGTDATTAPFFSDALRAGRLAAFYDFENEAKIFAGVHNQFRFAVTSVTGGERVARSRFAFYTRHLEDVPNRRFDLAPEEVLLLNPNTGTLPVFRTRTDAEITLGVYRRHPVLLREVEPHSNPWSIDLGRMLHMADDSAMFRDRFELTALGAQFDGWAWTKADAVWLPLYEAKMVGHFDHRFATYEDATQAQLNKGTLPRATASMHDDPEFEVLARYWLAASDIDEFLDRKGWGQPWLLGWRDIASAVNERSFVPAAIPRAGASGIWFVIPENQSDAVLLQSVMSSIVWDYLARQKLTGTHLTVFLTKQLACPIPAEFRPPCPWDVEESLAEFARARTVELVYTSRRMQTYGVSAGQQGPPFRWDLERRELMQAELDAMMLHVYGLTRREAEHVLDSFFVVRKYEERDHGEFRTRRLVLERYDAMQDAIDTGIPYETPLDPPPGHGPRHHAKEAT